MQRLAQMPQQARQESSQTSRAIAAAALATALLAACGKSAGQAAVPAATYGASAPITAAAAPLADHATTETAANAANAATAARAVAALGRQTLAYPDDVQMVLLAHRLAGTVAPLDAWAQRAQSVRQADEFSRAAALQAERQRLAAIETVSADAGELRLKTDGNISEYDASRGGFYLYAFEPGTHYKFSAYDETVSLSFDNIGDAYLWPLDAARAQALLLQIPQRAVDLDLHAVIVGVEQRADGLQVIGHLSDYRVSSRGSDHRQLDEVRLK